MIHQVTPNFIKTAFLIYVPSTVTNKKTLNEY